MQADGSLVRTEGIPDADLVPSLCTSPTFLAAGCNRIGPAIANRNRDATVDMAEGEPRKERAR